MAHRGLNPLFVVGLGNPGPQYAMTRHNVGYLIVEAAAASLGWALKEDRRFNAKVARGTMDQVETHFELPLTYMNLSGYAVKRYQDYFKIPVESLLVVVDDIALPFGKMKLKESGRAGGHKGLENIELYLGTACYKRLRVGIGHPGEKKLSDYVLESFAKDEQQALPEIIACGVEAILSAKRESFSHVMTKVNTRFPLKPLSHD